FLCTPTATPYISTLSLHDALPICIAFQAAPGDRRRPHRPARGGQLAGHDIAVTTVVAGAAQHHAWPRRPADLDGLGDRRAGALRSEEHTSELQSRGHLVCRLLLEK